MCLLAGTLHEDKHDIKNRNVLAHVMSRCPRCVPHAVSCVVPPRSKVLCEPCHSSRSCALPSCVNQQENRIPKKHDGRLHAPFLGNRLTRRGEFFETTGLMRFAKHEVWRQRLWEAVGQETVRANEPAPGIPDLPKTDGKSWNLLQDACVAGIQLQEKVRGRRKAGGPVRQCQWAFIGSQSRGQS